MINLNEVMVLDEGYASLSAKLEDVSASYNGIENVSLVPINWQLSNAVSNKTMQNDIERKNTKAMNLRFSSNSKEMIDNLNVLNKLQVLFDSLDHMFQGVVTINGNYYWFLNTFANIVENTVDLSSKISPFRYTKTNPSAHYKVQFPSYSRYDRRNASNKEGLDDLNAKLNSAPRGLALFRFTEQFIKPLAFGSINGSCKDKRKWNEEINLTFFNKEERNGYLDLFLKGSCLFPFNTQVNKVSSIEIHQNMLSMRSNEQDFNFVIDREKKFITSLDTNKSTPIFLSEAAQQALIHEKGVHVTSRSLVSPKEDIGYSLTSKYKTYTKGISASVGDITETPYTVEDLCSSTGFMRGLLGESLLQCSLEDTVFTKSYMSMSDIFTLIMSSIAVTYSDSKLSESRSSYSH